MELLSTTTNKVSKVTKEEAEFVLTQDNASNFAQLYAVNVQ